MASVGFSDSIAAYEKCMGSLDGSDLENGLVFPTIMSSKADSDLFLVLLAFICRKLGQFKLYKSHTWNCNIITSVACDRQLCVPRLEKSVH